MLPQGFNPIELRALEARVVPSAQLTQPLVALAQSPLELADLMRDVIRET
jgi:hypothetical protein